MFEGILTSALAQTVFVFVLLFALIFGILQKSKLLGDGSKQVNALVSLAISLLVVSVGYALDLITKLIPILAIGLVIILIFLLVRHATRGIYPAIGCRSFPIPRLRV